MRLGLTVLLMTALAALAAEDVPFITTPDNVTLAMLTLAKVKPEDYVIDLGSGDGRIVITAAKRFGARGLGVEIVPDLVRQSRENAAKAGVSSKASFREQDLFKTDLRPASVITLYLLPDVNAQLRPSLLALKAGTRIVSHDWDMADWKPDRTVKVPVPDKKVGIEKSSTVFLWVVPARVNGKWCGTGAAKGVVLEMAQEFQNARATFARGDRKVQFAGKIDGDQYRATTVEGRKDAVWLRADPGRLIVTRAQGELSTMQGGAFARC